MIEIAISVAVIGFALVAIIGVLPSGLNVQKDNREETIINQDGPYILDAIRGGAKGLDNLTNYIDSVGVVLVNTNTGALSTNYDAYDTNRTGAAFIGLMSLPKELPFDPVDVVLRVEAKMRALSGSALEQNGSNTAVAFSYLATSEIVPYGNLQPFLTNSTNYALYSDTNSGDYITRHDRWLETPHLNRTLYEARLKFSWPLLPPNNIGPNRQLFRSLVSGTQANAGVYRFFLPQKY